MQQNKTKNITQGSSVYNVDLENYNVTYLDTSF